ncbi:RagB/SusD family nutrient uptake outer membrane protein [Fulvivirga sp. M361]|uniref:RagB/SusD family nutrient uptake outer membrane protein n=1 Tax=Fulvivirga sp. M361 TaxID=2594266 RepID=UPI00117A5E5C|nr:RagB/SusD family nutrient uptake outer membrane protein [Fulvivirga sp. M361]TRX59945.1 RagB/SusD family nutrient uptake outer membrane protein [Fulvivirga sp. M361]
MKLFNIIITIILSVSLFSCDAIFDVDELADPNNPSLNSLDNGASQAQIQQLATGVMDGMRDGLFGYYRTSGTFGREVYNLQLTDNRAYDELLGRIGDKTIDNATFLNQYWDDFSDMRKRADDFKRIAEISASISDEEKTVISGFCNTIMAFAMLHNLNMQGENGIRIDVADPFNPGPFVSYTEALAEIKRLNDLGAQELSGGSSAFPFTLSSGFTGFDTPATFRTFNRALAARIAVYQEDWDGALAALNESFLDLNGALSTGPTHVYGAAPDILNPFYDPPQSSAASIIFAHESFVPDLEPGDTRINKVRLRDEPRVLSQPPITGDYELAVYASELSPVSIIRNEELILLFSEASIQVQGDNSTNGIEAIDVIRNAYELADYSGATDRNSLLNEMLRQKRFSLWFEGHRWVDMRRYGRLEELPRNDPDDVIFDRMPREFSEVQWDLANAG